MFKMEVCLYKIIYINRQIKIKEKRGGKQREKVADFHSDLSSSLCTAINLFSHLDEIARDIATSNVEPLCKMGHGETLVHWNDVRHAIATVNNHARHET